MAQFQYGMFAEDLVQLLDWRKTARRRQQRPAGVYAVLLKPGIHLVPEMPGTVVMIATGDNGRIVRQVFKQGGCSLKKQWKKVFATPGAASCTDLDIGVAQIRVHLEGVVPIHLEAADGAAIQRILASRQ